MTDDPIKRAEKAEAMNRHWQKQSVECWQAFSAMRDSINEVLPMPSVESDLLRGPEFSVSCEAVALAVSGHVSALQADLARLRADLANAGAVMVEAHIGRSASTSREVFADSCNHTMQAIDYMEQLLLSALSTLSPIAAAARVLLADPDTPDGFKGYILNRHDMDTTMSGYAEGAMDYLRALAEQEKADG